MLDLSEAEIKPSIRVGVRQVFVFDLSEAERKPSILFDLVRLR